jgi:ribonuclease J
MVKLIFYGGVNEIGGNKILLQDKKTRVMFDFGQSFVFGENYFTGYLAPRPVNGLGDYLAFDLLPRIEGLYSKEMLSHCDLPYSQPKIDAVFVSHAHFDHINHLQFLDPIIPVYTGFGTKIFMECMEDTGFSCNYGTHECHRFRTGDKIKVGCLTVEPVHVDHSIPAAYGFIIETSEGNIVYTGDLRRHGVRSDLTEDFIEKAKAADPIAMICEGTRMTNSENRQNISEPEVKKQAQDLIANTDKIVLATHYSRDIDRFNSFYKAAKKANRKLVITPKTAHLLTKLLDDKHLKVPDPMKDESILVYYKRKKSGHHDDKDYFIWERAFMNKMATHEYVKKNQKGLVMDLDFYQFTELIDIKPEPGSHFIHSMSEPFSEEDIEDQVMHNWIDHFQLQFRQMHASGHMNKEQLAEMVNYIKPKTLFPVHTENQLLFKTYFSGTQLLKTGKEYLIK